MHEYAYMRVYIVYMYSNPVDPYIHYTLKDFTGVHQIYCPSHRNVFTAVIL